MTKKISPAKLAELAKRRYEIAAHLAELTQEKAKIDAQLDGLPAGAYEAGEYIIQRNPRRMLDTEKIQQTFPPSRNPEYYKLTLDTAEFKKYFSDIQLEDFQKVAYI